MPLRIAFVKTRYVPFGGGETYLDLLMRRCGEEGHEVHVITTAWPGAAEAPWTVHPVRSDGLTRAARHRAFSRAAGRAAREGGFDVTVSFERTARQDVWRAGEGVHRVWLQRRRRFESPLKAWFLARTARQRTLLALEARAVRDTPLLIANSEMVRRDIERVYAGRHGRIVVIHNGVDDERFGCAGRAENRTRLRRAFDFAEADPLVLFVGSGFRRKGLEELLRALARVPRARLIVLGRDAAGPWLRRARRLGVAARVQFPGPQQDLAKWYHAADVTVLPSWFDSFSNVGLESLRCGTPFVTTRFAGVHELVPVGIGGEVIEAPDRTGALAEAIGRWIAPGDAARPEAIAAAVAPHTLEANVGRTLAVIRSAARRS